MMEVDMINYDSEPADGPGATRITWKGLGPGPAAQPVVVRGRASVEISGIFGEMDTVVSILGSNHADGDIEHTLTDPQGNPLNMRGADIKQISEDVYRIMPRVEGGGKDTAVTVTLLVRNER